MKRKIYHGAAYYPELWNERAIEEDIRLMKEAGIRHHYVYTNSNTTHMDVHGQPIWF